MSALKKARDAVVSLDEANPYDPGDVDTALDSVASTLSRALLKPKTFSWFRKDPPLEEVLDQLKRQGFDVETAVESLNEIRKILDENAYPDDQEIEDADEVKGHLNNLLEALSSVLNPEENNEAA
jgi:hypothetical protein